MIIVYSVCIIIRRETRKLFELVSNLLVKLRNKICSNQSNQCSAYSKTHQLYLRLHQWILKYIAH